MLSSRERLQERQGQHAAPRHEYLQQLVDEFQRSPDVLRKEELVANLANFAYDPINYASLGRLRIMDLFLDILDADQEEDGGDTSQKGTGMHSEGPRSERATTTARAQGRRRHHLVEFALGGICNCIPDPALQQQFIDGDGVEILGPYIVRVQLAAENELLTCELNVTLSALTIAYSLLDSSAFADITAERFMQHMRCLERHTLVQIANTAAAFLSRYQELLASA
ncbi:hypothetical protein BBJ28_00012952 [Nothophytophthora sp. Chile5]|nr:hypothetical protein BBJ28_00012952 [Nothophytophthora sp. Chile5]